MDIHSDEITGIRRHCFHRVAKTTIDISTLVPSRDSFSLWMALLRGNLRILHMVWHCKRFYTFLHVLLLRVESNASQSAKVDCYDLDYAADNANDFGNHCDCFDILLRTNCSSSVQRYDTAPENFRADVHQLPCFVP